MTTPAELRALIREILRDEFRSAFRELISAGTVAGGISARGTERHHTCESETESISMRKSIEAEPHDTESGGLGPRGKGLLRRIRTEAKRSEKPRGSPASSGRGR